MRPLAERADKAKRYYHQESAEKDPELEKTDGRRAEEPHPVTVGVTKTAWVITADRHQIIPKWS